MMTADLLSIALQDVELKRVASTDGGEYAGPCPFCRAGHDRFRVWPSKGRYWCRACGRCGDTIQYLRDLRGLTYREACDQLGVDGNLLRTRSRGNGPLTAQPLRTSAALAAPVGAWQSAGRRFVAVCQQTLWTPAGARALAWLRRRGLRDETIMRAGLGLSDYDRFQSPESWGLPGDHKQVWLPRGVVIPWNIGGELWRINIRRPSGEPKYVGPAGSSNGLYMADGLTGQLPTVLLEGEIDALTIAQDASDVAVAVATGSTAGSRHMRWISRLALAPLVLVAYDSDMAGEKAATYWLDLLSLAKRWRPFWDDVNAMAQSGVDIRSWVTEGVRTARWRGE
jgi:DNA primase